MPLSDELRALAAQVSNWGRWGDDDERGTLNLIDAAALARGVAAVRTGQRCSLAVPLDRVASPQEPGGAPGRINPRREMIAVNMTYTGDQADACFNDDNVSMSSSAGTHLDALAHVSYEGSLYNGFPAASVTEEDGATRCGAEKLGPVVTRGILLDVAAVHGLDVLESGYAITAADLDAAVAATGLSVEPGDAVLVRTGHMRHLRAGAIQTYNQGSAGLSAGTVSWFHRHDVALVATDTYIFEVFPPQDWSQLMVVHMLHLRDMGLVQGQNFDLEELAVVCSVEGRWEFLLAASPEPLVGACSAPVHPVAVV